jgi:hypothetical protein
MLKKSLIVLLALIGVTAIAGVVADKLGLLDE